MDSKEAASYNYTKQRRINYAIFCLLYFIYGVETALTISTLWAYLSFLVHSNHTHIWYGLITCSYYLVDAFSGLILTQLVDQNKRIREIILYSISLIIIGNICYIIHFSAYFLLVGRIISGMGGGWKPFVIAEISRVYPRHERAIKVIGVLAFYACAHSVGPGINIIFTNVNFRIESLHVTYANVPGIYVSALLFVIQILFYFKFSIIPSLLEDDPSSSKENLNSSVKKHMPIYTDDTFDPSSNLNKPSKNDSNNEVIPEKNSEMNGESNLVKENKVKSIWSFFPTLLLHKDALLIIVSTCFTTFKRFMTFMWVSILVLDDLKWNINIVYVFYISFIAVYMALVIPVSTKKVPPGILFQLILFTYPMSIISSGLILVLHLHHDSHVVNIILFCFTILSFGIVCCAEVFLASMLSLTLPNNMIAKGESLRMFSTRVGTILGTLCAGVSYHLMPIITPVMIGYIAILFIAFVIRRNSFRNPAQIK